MGMTQGRIPESRIADYCDRKGWPDYLRELFTNVMLGLDRGYINWCNKERERRAEQAKR